MKNMIAFAATLISAAALAQVPAGGQYVSLGSSYAAGPGVGSPDPASGKCARSLSNYARQLAANRHLLLVDVACSGATIANILDHGQHGFPAQIDAVTADTRLVSVLIGGNDIDYVGNLSGLSCRDTGGANCHIADPANVERRLADLPAALDRVVADIQRRAPSSRIILVGYLPAVPAKGDARCSALPLLEADGERMRDVAIRLAQAIRGSSNRNGAGIVNSTLIGAGHDACSAQPFVAGYRPDRNAGWPSPVAYHPTQAGMDRVAAALDDVISH
jgi:hypothetical protein